MWSSPSVFAKTPKRHIQEAIAASNKEAYLEKPHHSLPPKPPPRHARVSFYDGLWRIQDGQPANLFADIPLEPCGSLDLKKVCKKWGLESCVPIDPMRWEIFQPGKNPHMLSSLAVAVLSEEDGCIKFIEQSVSVCTQNKRIVHESITDMTTALLSLMFIVPLLIQATCIDALERHTSLVQMYRNSWRKRRQLGRTTKTWISVAQNFTVNWPLVSAVMGLLFFILVLVAVIMGKIQFAVGQRLRNWTYTGSFTL